MLELKRTGLETGLEKIVGRWVAVQIHELGVSMGAISMVTPAAKGKYSDTDDGMPFEECVYSELTR
ncbi:MAG: hypothetical protein IPJ30_12935 [Acidobacteria bacterium]|nr:hypothetical protein [Acidobacteriota bacterium]